MLYKLYLDESGTPNLVDGNLGLPYFILSGFIVNEEQEVKLKIKADQVKFKYWGRTNIVFHSREIGRKENDFLILKNPTIEQNFQKDLMHMLVSTGGKSIIVAVNKEKVSKFSWDGNNIYKNTSREILKFFIEYLYSKNDQGQIIIESAGTKRDIAFYKEYIYFLANGIALLDLNHKKIKQILTSISFVSKSNQDIETQVADLLAYPASHICMVMDGIRMTLPNSYEDNMCKILNNKILCFVDKKASEFRRGFVRLNT